MGTRDKPSNVRQSVSLRDLDALLDLIDVRGVYFLLASLEEFGLQEFEGVDYCTASRLIGIESCEVVAVIIATSKNLRSHTAFHCAVVVKMFDKGLTLLTSHMCFGRYWRSGSTSPSFGSSSKAFKSSAHRPSPKTDVESSSTRFMMFGHRVAHCDLGAFQRQDGLFLESFSVC